MAKNELGDLRRSAAVQTFGPGAIIDFRAGDAPVSGVAAGLEEWDRNFPPAGMLHPQAILEERLQKKLGVRGFRLPPVRNSANDADAMRSLVAVRFPEWLQCPGCNLIAPEGRWDDEPGRAGRWCASCTQKAPGRRRMYVIPVRFITACERGHIDEFPWHVWVQHAPDCARRRGFLKLTAESAGLAGLVLSCPECGKKRSMDGIFGKPRAGGRSHFPPCRGRRPWLADGTEDCGGESRAMQRGASNLHFPVIESALSIPPWSDRLQEALGVHWDNIRNTHPEDRSAFIRILARGDLAQTLADLGLTAEQLATEVDLRIAGHEAIETSDLRLEEYRQLTGGTRAEGLDHEFEIRPCVVPGDLAPWIGRLVRAVRLREVRAMKGFTRIQPPGDPDAGAVAPLSKARLDWLPAIEVRGEGIFLTLDEHALSAWEERQDVAERTARIHDASVAAHLDRYGPDAPPPRPVSARLLLLHGFAHALMRQLTLDCGYATTALRERLYASTGDQPMAGLLIYTATSDDDGTLGGLQRQGDPVRMARTVVSAIRAQAWCSSDPLCIENMLAPDDGLSLAACHACLLAPETACEEFNRLLDRALLVGTPDTPETGFFHMMLQGDYT